MNTDRRRLLAGIVSCLPLSRVWPPMLEPVIGSESHTRTPAEATELLAEWELMANQSNWPDRWQLMNYTGMIAWTPRVAIVYGVGTADQAEEDFVGVLRWLQGGDRWFAGRVLSSARTPCKRSWAIAVEGLAPIGPGLNNQMRAPWKVETALAIRAGERAAGRSAPRSFIV